jgi:hypothetical protein
LSPVLNYREAICVAFRTMLILPKPKLSWSFCVSH